MELSLTDAQLRCQGPLSRSSGAFHCLHRREEILLDLSMSFSIILGLNQTGCSVILPGTTSKAHFFPFLPFAGAAPFFWPFAMSFIFFLMAWLLCFLLIITWKRWRSVRPALRLLLASFLAMGVAAHFSERPAFLEALIRVPVRAPRARSIFILVNDNLFSGKIILGKSSASTSTRFSSATSTIVTYFP